MKQIDIYTDGACSGNPGPGGWGAVLIDQETLQELSGAEKHTTNQRMELTAAIAALNSIKESCHIKLHSDSAYLINAFRQHWLTNWQRNGWLNSQKQPVVNQDLWEQLLLENERHQIEWIKVPGHRDNHYNNRCDELARSAITASSKS